jgi:hypothetical protein
MELFLNLCWLSLLVPAYLLWRQRTVSKGSDRPARNPVAPFVFVCVLGCALVLLFPVISASDDLHAMRPEMEESERAFRHASHGASTSHALTHFSQIVLPRAASVTPDFRQRGMVLAYLPQIHRVFFTTVPAGRAPPLGSPTAL